MSKLSAQIDAITVSLQADTSPFVEALKQGQAILDDFKLSAILAAGWRFDDRSRRFHREWAYGTESALTVADAYFLTFKRED